MKKIIFIFLLSVSALLLSSCLKEDHTVRFTNNFNQVMNNVSAGTAHLGSVAPGQTTGYQSINTGNFSISGTSATGQQLSGSGSISGKGKHKWTITLSSAGTVSMSEDKK